MGLYAHLSLPSGEHSGPFAASDRPRCILRLGLGRLVCSRPAAVRVPAPTPGVPFSAPRPLRRRGVCTGLSPSPTQTTFPSKSVLAGDFLSFPWTFLSPSFLPTSKQVQKEKREKEGAFSAEVHPFDKEKPKAPRPEAPTSTAGNGERVRDLRFRGAIPKWCPRPPRSWFSSKPRRAFQDNTDSQRPISCSARALE